ncbi:MAG TPA: bifunctional hydroxymethylpyrimidine kinase/phosphomethylpyrimidine kinase [Tissierellia bacterium]|nr:bifunctional hydroxymethylpyrimidine kinase/phosphomethylpyrimidine kinase [Tissierellia bacterium]
MKTALTIAGSDSSGGAGIQADLKTMTALGVYGMSAITALTAQNTAGVQGIMEVTPDFLARQLESIFSDITPDAIKVGMVSSAGLIEVIAQKLTKYQAAPVVVDPVMVATSGAKFLQTEAIECLQKKLLPLATVVTPNIPEAEILAQMVIESPEDMMSAAGKISQDFHSAVLLKGGHQVNDANDLLVWQEKSQWFYGERIDNPNTHGTGCTLSSAIAAYLAQARTLPEAIRLAKHYITGSLSAGLDLGRGSGPLDHMWNIKKESK